MVFLFGTTAVDCNSISRTVNQRIHNTILLSQATYRISLRHRNGGVQLRYLEIVGDDRDEIIQITPDSVALFVDGKQRHCELGTVGEGIERSVCV